LGKGLSLFDVWGEKIAKIANLGSKKAVTNYVQNFWKSA
jgi:hypothetical protein